MKLKNFKICSYVTTQYSYGTNRKLIGELGPIAENNTANCQKRIVFNEKILKVTNLKKILSPQENIYPIIPKLSLLLNFPQEI